MPGEYAVRSRPLLPRGKQERLFSFLGYGEGRGMPGMTSSENPRKLRLTRAARRLRRAAVRRRNKERSVNRTRRERSARRVKRFRFGCMPIIDREHAGTETKESSGRNGGFPFLPLLFRLCGYTAVT